MTQYLQEPIVVKYVLAIKLQCPRWISSRHDAPLRWLGGETELTTRPEHNLVKWIGRERRSPIRRTLNPEELRLDIARDSSI
jgi:hypothetical protein